MELCKGWSTAERSSMTAGTCSSCTALAIAGHLAGHGLHSQACLHYPMQHQLSLFACVQVLIPGAGLGRLCLDVAAEGYAAQVGTAPADLLEMPLAAGYTSAVLAPAACNTLCSACMQTELQQRPSAAAMPMLACPAARPLTMPQPAAILSLPAAPLRKPMPCRHVCRATSSRTTCC